MKAWITGVVTKYPDPFDPNEHFLYPMKTSEKLTVF